MYHNNLTKPLFFRAQQEAGIIRNQRMISSKEIKKEDAMIDSICLEVEKELLALIPKVEASLVQILSTTLKTNKDQRLLLSLIKGTFNKEDITFRKTYCIHFFPVEMPIVIGREQLTNFFDPLNSFWENNASIRAYHSDPYYFFDFSWAKEKTLI